MNDIITWKVIPSTEPIVIRNCPKCGCHSEYESTGNFRVNANQNHIDVWLIYQCNKCKSTWNMEILTRVNSNKIKKSLYLKFLSNDPKLAKEYAFDAAVHSRNKSILNYQKVNYDIEGYDFTLNKLMEVITIELICDYAIDIRLDKIISRQLGISREEVKQLGISGKLIVEGVKDISKAKLKSKITLTLSN